MVGGGHKRLLEVAAWEHGRTLVEHVPEVIHPAVPHAGQSRGALGLIDQRELSYRIYRGDGHSEDQGSRKLGNSVSPPSTKIVCPVM